MSKPQKEPFWVDDPLVLFCNFRLLPTPNMTLDEKLNVLTRLSLIVGGGLYFAKNEHWFTFLMISLMIIVLFKITDARRPHNVKEGDGETSLKEDFTLVPTYQNPDFHTTTVAPLFAEEWEIYPPAYDLYTNSPPDAFYQEPLIPQQYPYGQFLTRTNLLPSDEQSVRMLNGGPKQARSYVNGAFLRHELGFRENMTRLFKKKLARRFRSSSASEYDTFSPYHSY